MGKLATIGTVLGGAVDLAKTFFGDKTKRDEQYHLEQAALHEAYGKEFSYAADGRTWFDGFMDGINRIPRPAITFGVFYVFYIAVEDPERFKRIMSGMQTVPEMWWWLALAIIGFFFGGRVIDKVRLPKTRALLVSRPQRDAGVEFESETAHAADTGNASIDDWKRKVYGEP